jgi:hypothetical protein
VPVEDEPWEGRCLMAAYQFASRCKELKDSNPYDVPAIKSIAEDLLTELWDHGFSVSEIKAAFAKALSDLPRYAAGEDRRGDKDRP